jgi:hypothetical protein
LRLLRLSLPGRRSIGRNLLGATDGSAGSSLAAYVVEKMQHVRTELFRVLQE